MVSEAVGSFTLAARVEALSVLPLGDAPMPDVLLVTVRPAKVSLKKKGYLGVMYAVGVKVVWSDGWMHGHNQHRPTHTPHQTL